MIRFGYKIVAAVTVLIGLAFVSLAMVYLYSSSEPGLERTDADPWLVATAVVLGVGGMVLWPLAQLCRRLWTLGLDQPETPHAAQQRRRWRFLRLSVCMAVSLPFGAWYMERASHSAYIVPPIAEASQMTGTLIAPSWRAKSRVIAVEAGDDRIALGCQPNERYSANCLSRAEHERLAGSRVTARFFTYPNALRSRRILVQLLATDGSEVVSFADQRKALADQRMRDLRRTGWSTVPLSVWIACVIWLMIELYIGTQAALLRRFAAPPGQKHA